MLDNAQQGGAGAGSSSSSRGGGLLDPPVWKLVDKVRQASKGGPKAPGSSDGIWACAPRDR